MKIPKVATKSNKREHPLEKIVERGLKKKIARLGGVSFKFTSPNRRSVSDQVAVLWGHTFFIEVKMHGKKLTPKQRLFAVTIRETNNYCVMLAGHSGVDMFIDWLIENKTNFVALSDARYKMIKAPKESYELK